MTKNDTLVERLMSIGITLEALPVPMQFYLLGVADTLKRQLVTEEKR